MQITVERAGRNPAVDLERMFERIARPNRQQITGVAFEIRRGLDTNFEDEASAAGPWRALAAMTVAERILLGYGGEHPILQRTQGLRKSFTQSGATGHVERYISESSGWSLEIGSNHPLAEQHEYGTDKIPSRPMSPLQSKSLERIGGAIAQMLDRIERATLK